MSKRVLVLGGAGFLGQVVGRHLALHGWQPILASRRSGVVEEGTRTLALDVLQPEALKLACGEADAIVNCVAGDAAVIAQGAKNLAMALQGSSGKPLVHLSSMAVYGGAEGRVVETQPYGDQLGWYGDAKVEAERVLSALADRHPVTLLRPGCIYGPGSDQWVARVCRLLVAGRIGDLGAFGDGWSNLVHVNDVADAVARALAAGPSTVAAVYNLSAPDSPRWNEYFIGMSRALGVTPLRRLDGRRLKLDAKVFSVGLKIAQLVAGKAKLSTKTWPEPLPPSLLRLWQQQIRLSSEAATRDLLLQWTPFAQGLADSAAWFSGRRSRKS